MGRRRIEIEPVLLGVLAVIALAPGQPEDALLQDRVAFVPEGERQAHSLLAIADPAQAVFVPAIDARARVLVRNGVPGVAAGAVLLPHRPPPPFRPVTAPALP